MGATISGAKAAAGCVAAAILLAGCGATSGVGGGALGNLMAFNSLQAPPLAEQKQIFKVDCPTVAVDDAASSVRVGAGGASGDIKYQYDFGQLARQCDVENGQIAIKVGVEGRIVLGPAGTPGTFVAPVRIAVKRESDGKIVAEKIYRTDVSVPAGSGEAVFDTVSDPLIVPYTREQADQDYSIVVGFAQAGGPSGGGPSVAHPKRRRRG